MIMVAQNNNIKSFHSLDLLTLYLYYGKENILVYKRFPYIVSFLVFQSSNIFFPNKICLEENSFSQL